MSARYIPSVLILLILGLGHSTAQVPVKIVVRGLENNEGALLLAVFNDQEQFPYEPFLEFKWPKDTVTGHSLATTINLPHPGNYAFSALDDENDNGELDRKFIGFTTEHFGFSNNARPGLFRPPSYFDCLVEIHWEDNTVPIYLQRKNKEDD